MAEETTQETTEQTNYPAVKIDESQHTVSFSGGRFKHFLAAPGKKQILERDVKMKHEILLNKNNNPVEDDGSEQDALDAEYYDALKYQDAEGYNGKPVPMTHKARAFRGLYARAFEVSEDADIFADEIPVREIFGDPDNPTGIVVHWMRQPQEKEHRKMLVAINKKERKPAGNGKEKIVVPSYLRKSMDFYNAHCVGIDGGMVGGRIFEPEIRAQFVEATDPLIQRMIVKTLVEAINEASLD